MANTTPALPGHEKALRTYVKLMRAAESVTSRIHRHLVAAGLTISQFGILEALLHLEPLSQTELGQKILKSSGNICTVITNLERRDLVRRQRLASDRRVIRVYLTDAGRHLISTLFPHHQKAVWGEMKTLSEPELDQLGRLCKKLGRPQT